MENFPPNSKKSEEQARDQKHIERVTSGDAVRRKPSLGKQFRNTFIGGDAKTAVQYVIFNVLIPAAKDAIAEAGATAIEKLIYGDSGRGSRRPGPMGNALGHVAYHRMGPQREDRPPTATMLSRRSRSTHSFDEIVISSRGEAEEVIDRLFDLISKYDSATVADLYELTGLSSTHTDHKWGWTDLRGASVGRVRGGGYLLDLPQPGALA